MFLYKKWLYQSLLYTPQKCSECRKWHHFLKFSGARLGPRTPRLNGLASLAFPHFVQSMSGISKRFGQNVLNFLEEKGPRAYNSYFLAETLHIFTFQTFVFSPWACLFIDNKDNFESASIKQYNISSREFSNLSLCLC